MNIKVGNPRIRKLENGEEIIELPIVVEGRRIIEAYERDGTFIPEMSIGDAVPVSEENQKEFLEK